MSWICENCSTANGNTTPECFVCGQTKPTHTAAPAAARVSAPTAPIMPPPAPITPATAPTSSVTPSAAPPTASAPRVPLTAERVADLIYKWVMRISRFAFLAASIAAVIVVSILVIGKLLNGSLNDSAEVLLVMNEHAMENCSLRFAENWQFTMAHLADAPSYRIDERAMTLLHQITDVVSTRIPLFFDNMIHNVISQLELIDDFIEYFEFRF